MCVCVCVCVCVIPQHYQLLVSLDPLMPGTVMEYSAKAGRLKDLISL